MVRKGVVDFLARLAAIPGLAQLALTTNGVYLESMAEELRRTGVQRPDHPEQAGKTSIIRQ